MTPQNLEDALDELAGSEFTSDAVVSYGSPTELADLLQEWRQAGITDNLPASTTFRGAGGLERSHLLGRLHRRELSAGRLPSRGPEVRTGGAVLVNLEQVKIRVNSL